MDSKHKHLLGKPLDYFQNCLRSFQGQQTTDRQQADRYFQKAKVGKASYQVAYRVAQCKKTYTIDEQLILPAATDMCKTMLSNDECANRLKLVPLSDSKNARRLADVASDVRE